MSDYPYKIGDLVEIKTSLTKSFPSTLQGVIVTIKPGGFFDVLVDGKMRLVHRNYIVTPKIKAVKLTGGVK